MNLFNYNISNIPLLLPSPITSADCPLGMVQTAVFRQSSDRPLSVYWLNSILGITTAAAALALAAVEMPRILLSQGSGRVELARTLVSGIS